MAAKVCKECNSKTGAVGCDHWEQWPENLDRPHNWNSQISANQMIRCLECGLETTIADISTGKVSAFNCSEYKIQKPKPLPKRVKLKVVNAFKSGEHQVLWLAGGMAVYKRPGVEELFDTLDDASKHCPVELKQDLNLIEQWKGGYELPADEHFDWPSAFIADET